MSHDSGFRRGGQDYTHKPPKQSTARYDRQRKFERNAEQRFHQHEKAQEAGPDTDHDEA